MQPIPNKKNVWRKRIPTLAGLGILVLGLIAGIVFLGTGPGVFAPRATPETTPQRIKVTNITDTGFTISFFTAEQTPGFIKYGTAPNQVNSQTGDDRDQLSGTVGSYRLHHITVRGLRPETTYYYTLGTGTNATYDNNGSPFTLTTSTRSGAPSAAKTAYGTVLDQGGSPANGAIVYVNLDGVGEMSSLVKSSGSWAIPLSNARLDDGSGYAQIEDNDVLNILVQGTQANLTSELTVSVADSQPVDSITLGENGPTSASTSTDVEPSVAPATVSLEEQRTIPVQGTGEVGEAMEREETDVTQPGALASEVASTGVGGSDIASASESASTTPVTEVNLNGASNQVVTTQSPSIVGTAVPNAVIDIEVNSNHTITQQLTADANGNFVLDLEALSQTLEPGEHTATYSYTDPTTQQVVTRTVNFTVEPESAGVGGPVPFGSPNPVTVETATQSAMATATESATASVSAEPKGGQSTRSAMPSTSSGVPVSGSVGTTLAFVLGGIFFIFAGGWSYYLATQIDTRQD